MGGSNIEHDNNTSCTDGSPHSHVKNLLKQGIGIPLNFKCQCAQFACDTSCTQHATDIYTRTILSTPTAWKCSMKHREQVMQSLNVQFVHNLCIVVQHF